MTAIEKFDIVISPICALASDLLSAVAKSLRCCLTGADLQPRNEARTEREPGPS